LFLTCFPYDTPFFRYVSHLRLWAPMAASGLWIIPIFILLKGAVLISRIYSVRCIILEVWSMINIFGYVYNFISMMNKTMHYVQFWGLARCSICEVNLSKFIWFCSYISDSVIQYPTTRWWNMKNSTETLCLD